MAWQFSCTCNIPFPIYPTPTHSDQPSGHAHFFVPKTHCHLSDYFTAPPPATNDISSDCRADMYRQQWKRWKNAPGSHGSHDASRKLRRSASRLFFVIAAGIIAVSVVMRLSTPPHTSLSQTASNAFHQRRPSYRPPFRGYHVPKEEVPTVRFDVCHGFSNQRLSIIYGVIAAKRANRAVVIPTLLADGEHEKVEKDHTMMFADVFDEDYFIQVLSQNAAILVLRDEDVPGSVHVSIDRVLNGTTIMHVNVACPLFQLEIAEHEQVLVKLVLDAMVPSQKVKVCYHCWSSLSKPA
mmetsp:Transcript_15112/g.44546  ORF Transcript_15112/g.44546 Transcript_15112/m.44546 type:complete len:295 (-) Transcript_15112:256-1140(-)